MRKSEALNYRKHIEAAVQSLSANEALTVPSLHPKWEPGKTCEAGKRYYYGGKLYEVNEGMTHTAQSDWTPDITTAMFAKVNETHEGTKDDPIPYEGNMVLVKGLYYVQNYVIYRCIRDTVNPVYNPLSELAGLYVVEA